MVATPVRIQTWIDEANRDAPNRRKSSDGGYVDKPGGHNIGARGFHHAYDFGQSMPGTPYWEDQFEQFDVWAHCYRIAREYTAASDAERQRRWRWLYDGGYMVWYDGTKDIIFRPLTDRQAGREPTIRQNGAAKREHFQHAHLETAETVAAENDTQPIFGAAPKPPPHVSEEDNMIFLEPGQKITTKPKYVNVALAKKKVYLHGARVKQADAGETALVIPSPTPLLGAARTTDGFVVINEDSQPYWYQWA